MVTIKKINKAALPRPWESCVSDFGYSLATVKSVSNKLWSRSNVTISDHDSRT